MQFTAPYSFVTAGNLAVHLHPEHLADLRASGLKDETIRAAGAYSLAPRWLELFFRGAVPSEITSALCFPYQGGGFARIKLFPALGKMKYAQPPQTGARLYIPLPIGDGPLFICEGEKKTLAAWQAGLNTAGIGGVWNWLSKATGAPIDDLNLIRWDGREVTIIPDSDVFGRADLLRAIYALGRELRGLGANVYVAQLPQPSAAKVGLDDYLAAGGRASGLEVFSLSHRIFKGLDYWHGQWKFQKALKAA
jgi:putative DNA primase/helicase